MLRRLTILVCLYNAQVLNADGMKDFLKHSGAEGSQHGRLKNDTKFHYSNSEVPHLPFVTGYMGTHGTYRFLTLNEQTALVVGEPKHGLWRIHENGMIREYRKKGKVGIRNDVDPNSKQLNQNTLDIIKNNYAHYIPEEGSSGYKYPEKRISDGEYDGMKNYVDYIDLSIYHPKYGGRYNDHVPIDLNYFYCTLSGPDIPHIDNAWKYAMAQPMANRIGPLGRRAGIDIKETHFNVLRLEKFEDANIWVNVEEGFQYKNLNDLKTKTLKLNYQKLDLDKMEYEIYLIERPFFNHNYLFVCLIMENKELSPQFTYVRPHGVYWEELSARGKTAGLTVRPENHFPGVPVKDFPIEGQSTNQTIYGLPVYGIHHVERPRFGLSGGFCPMRGGDWGRYPWGNSGAGFSSNYEEIGPLCDGVLIDMKFWGNLWSETWDDPQLLLGNAGFDGKYVIDYVGDGNVYGAYTDPYLNNKQNPFLMDLTWNGKIVQHDDPSKQSSALSLKMNFSRPGKLLEYNRVDIKRIDLPSCPAVPATTTTTTTTTPTTTAKTTTTPTTATTTPPSPIRDSASNNDATNNKNGPFSGWESLIIVVTCISVVLNIVVIFFLVVVSRKSVRDDTPKRAVKSYDNEAGAS